jgi:hypothetical protein
MSMEWNIEWNFIWWCVILVGHLCVICFMLLFRYLGFWRYLEGLCTPIVLNYIVLCFSTKARQLFLLTLGLLMSYIYGAPSKARNLTSYRYIYICVCVCVDEIFYWGFCFLNHAFC